MARPILFLLAVAALAGSGKAEAGPNDAALAAIRDLYSRTQARVEAGEVEPLTRAFGSDQGFYGMLTIWLDSATGNPIKIVEESDDGHGPWLSETFLNEDLEVVFEFERHHRFEMVERGGSQVTENRLYFADGALFSHLVKTKRFPYGAEEFDLSAEKSEEQIADGTSVEEKQAAGMFYIDRARTLDQFSRSTLNWDTFTDRRSKLGEAFAGPLAQERALLLSVAVSKWSALQVVRERNVMAPYGGQLRGEVRSSYVIELRESGKASPVDPVSVERIMVFDGTGDVEIEPDRIRLIQRNAVDEGMPDYEGELILTARALEAMHGEGRNHGIEAGDWEIALTGSGPVLKTMRARMEALWADSGWEGENDSMRVHGMRFGMPVGE